MKSTMTKWQVRLYSAKGVYLMDTPCDSEADAREAAIRQLRVQGQKTCRTEVYGPNGHVATYKRGKEVKR